MSDVKLVQGDYADHVAAEKLTNGGRPFTEIAQLFGAAHALVAFMQTQTGLCDWRQLRAAVPQYDYNAVHTALMYLVRRKFFTKIGLSYSLGPQSL